MKKNFEKIAKIAKNRVSGGTLPSEAFFGVCVGLYGGCGRAVRGLWEGCTGAEPAEAALAASAARALER